MTAEIRASLAHLRQLHAQSTHMQQQIKHLRDEQCKLDLDFERKLERHARADCKQLASMMYTKLPLELREQIYQYLYLEDAPIPIGSYHFTTYVPGSLRSEENNPPAHSEPFIVIPEGATRQDHSIERDENIVHPDSILLNPAYLGQDVARDASMYYYKSNTFTICTLENALAQFLFRDPIHYFIRHQTSAEPLGLIPIDHIRNLEIRVKHEHYLTYLTFYETLFDGEETLLQDIFGALYDFCIRISPATASKLHVEICMMSASIPLRNNLNDRTHINLLEAIRVPVYMLKHDLGTDVKVIHYDENSSPFPKDKTAVFQLSKDQWSQERSAFEDSGVGYSPLYYLVKSSMDPSESLCLMRDRWGLRFAFDSSCTEPIAEFGRWPNAVPEFS